MMKPLCGLLIALLMLPGCSGGSGGGGGGGVTPPGGGGTGSPTTASFVVSSTSTTTIMSTGTPQYISKATAALSISVNSSVPATYACSGSCSSTFVVPAGSDTFSIAAIDGAGVTLSKTTVVVSCAEGQNTVIRAVLSGLVTSADVTLATKYLAMGAPSSTNVIVTARDPDGLALSSRNAYLSPAQRREALAVFHALQQARGLIANGERHAATVEKEMTELIRGEAPSIRIDFATVADLHTLVPARKVLPNETLIALAVYVGSTRLIDNLIVRLGNGPPVFQ